MARLKLLLSAFSCEPGKGSEPEVGYRAALAAAERHDVWLLTSATGVPALRRALDGTPARERIRVIPVPVGVDEGGLGLVSFHRHYDRWQRRIAPLAADLHRQVRFDVAHHVTLATLWTRVGIAALPVPLVWGPVGGGVEPPPRLVTALGARGAAEDALRFVGRRLMTRLPHTGLDGRTDAVVLAQNRQTAAALDPGLRPDVVSNGTCVDLPRAAASGPRTADVAFVGRLVAWKGTILALRAFGQLRHPTALLRFYGSGSDRRRIERVAARLGVADRVRFEGWLPREDLLARIAVAGVVVHPSLHDDAGLGVAEALSLGTPVVCLDHGGPTEVARSWPDAPSTLVPPTSPAATVRAVAAAIDRYLADPPPVPAHPTPPAQRFADRLHTAYEEAAGRPPATLLRNGHRAGRPAARQDR